MRGMQFTVRTQKILSRNFQLTRAIHPSEFYPRRHTTLTDHTSVDCSVISYHRNDALNHQDVQPTHSTSVDMLWKIVHSQQQQLNRVEHQLSQVRNVVLGSRCGSTDALSDFSQSCSSSVSSRQSFNYKARRMKFRESLEDFHPPSDDDSDELMSPAVAALIQKYTGSIHN